MRSLFFALLFLLFYSCKSQQKKEFLGIPESEIETALINHLNDWYPQVIDTINGGYFTNFEYNWERSNDQMKMIVTQARDLWTASKASQLFPDNEIYKKAADHGYNFITEKMWDTKNGGFQLYLNSSDPNYKINYKLIYGNTFVLFALAEYSKINSSDEVLQWVLKTFNWMDLVAHDNEYLGYYNLVLSNELKSEMLLDKDLSKKIGWGNPTWKDQNTSIHLLEALTTAYEVLAIPPIQKRLEEMLHLVRDTMTQENGTLKLYFTQNWEAINYSDSTREFILDNQNIDHVSFGHNIETAYLLIDASKQLYGKVDSKTLEVAKKLTDHSLKYGFAPNYKGIFDKGYVFNHKMEIINRNKTWWSQAEALHTLALMASYYPEEQRYPLAFQQMWNYIQTYSVDAEFGGFYNNGIDESPETKLARKAHNWKGPYHDGRALMLLWVYANE